MTSSLNKADTNTGTRELKHSGNTSSYHPAARCSFIELSCHTFLMVTFHLLLGWGMVPEKTGLNWDNVLLTLAGQVNVCLKKLSVYRRKQSALRKVDRVRW